MGLRVLAWGLLCCAAAGAAGLALRLPTVWGEGISFWTYAIPWPMGWGLLHLPPLAFGAAVLGWAARRGRGAGTVVAAAALGLLGAAALSAWDPQFKRWEWHPWTLFLAVDGALLLPFALLALFTGAARAPTAPRWAGLAALLLPLLPVAALQGLWTHRQAQPSVAMTWLDPKDPSIQRVLVAVERVPASLAEGCALLARLAPEPYPGQGGPGGTPKMHRILELRLRSSLASGGAGREEPPPLLSYEWRPQTPQTGECRDVSFTPPRY